MTSTLVNSLASKEFGDLIKTRNKNDLVKTRYRCNIKEAARPGTELIPSIIYSIAYLETSVSFALFTLAEEKCRKI